MPAVLAAIPGILAAVGGGSAAAGAATLGSLALGGTQLGMNIAGVGKPGAPSPFPTTAQTQAQVNADKSIIARGSGNQQQATEGGTSPNYLAEILGQNFGALNNVNQLQDLISAGTPGVTSGGNPTDLAVPSLGTNSLSGGSGLADYGNIFGGS